MATVFDYLEKLKQENPEYRRLNNTALYKKLKGQDTNMPSWESLDNPQKTSTVQDKTSPGFFNSLLDWTDYGINESSAGFVKAAYNHSLTGLAYQLHNGEARFDLEEYDPGIVQDVLSAVLSFSMPLDIATMMTGGIAGRAVKGSLASASMQSRLTSNLVKGVAVPRPTLPPSTISP